MRTFPAGSYTPERQRDVRVSLYVQWWFVSGDVYSFLYEQAVLVVGVVNDFSVVFQKFLRWLLVVFD